MDLSESPGRLRRMKKVGPGEWKLKSTHPSGECFLFMCEGVSLPSCLHSLYSHSVWCFISVWRERFCSQAQLLRICFLWRSVSGSLWMYDVGPFLAFAHTSSSTKSGQMKTLTYALLCYTVDIKVGLRNWLRSDFHGRVIFFPGERKLKSGRVPKKKSIPDMCTMNLPSVIIHPNNL